MALTKMNVFITNRPEKFGSKSYALIMKNITIMEHFFKIHISYSIETKLVETKFISTYKNFYTSIL